MCYYSIFKWHALLAMVHKLDAYKDKKKTMSHVKYIYLFFKVNKCSELVVYSKDRMRGELVAGRPVSVEGLRPDVVAPEVVVG